ncbi:MAG TPA: hypothetical protein VFI31_20895 [Pirellulales bacterium]|nr:hypothetical protein [Pirellulales bacterium]
MIRRSLSTAEDGRLIVVNFGRNGHRARVTQWLDDQNVKYWVVV